MRSPLERVEEHAIADAVAAGWGLHFDEFTYLPEGGGAYHWIGRVGGTRWVVTCDDLDTKPWLGPEREAVFAELLAAYGAAIELHESGAEFVVAAVPALTGAPAARIDERHSVSVFPFVDGVAGRWGEQLRSAAYEHLVSLLARLHTHAGSLPALITRGVAIEGRADLEAALNDLNTVWDGGPFSEEARVALATHAHAVTDAFAEFDTLTARVHDLEPRTVLTHGEPHPGNLIRTRDGNLALLDWDTVALARPERDLWMLADVDVSLLDHYRDLTGITPEPDALQAFRLMWALADLAAFTAQLHAEHGSDADAARALLALKSILAGTEPQPYGSPPTYSPN